MELKAYIYENHKSIKEFAAKYAIDHQRVGLWCKRGYVVHGDKIYSPKFDLIKNIEGDENGK